MRKTAKHHEVTIWLKFVQHLLFSFATDLLTWSKKVKRRREWRKKDHRLQRHLPQRRLTKLKQVYLLQSSSEKSFIGQHGTVRLF